MSLNETRIPTSREKVENYLLSWWNFIIFLLLGMITGILITPYVVPPEYMKPGIEFGVGTSTMLIFGLINCIIAGVIMTLASERIKTHTKALENSTQRK